MIVLDIERRECNIPADEASRKIVARPNGIEKADIVHGLEQAGLDAISYEKAFNFEWLGSPLSYFIAKGVKPQYVIRH